MNAPNYTIMKSSLANSSYSNIAEHNCYYNTDVIITIDFGEISLKF